MHFLKFPIIIIIAIETRGIGPAIQKHTICTNAGLVNPIDGICLHTESLNDVWLQLPTVTSFPLETTYPGNMVEKRL